MSLWCTNGHYKWWNGTAGLPYVAAGMFHYDTNEHYKWWNGTDGLPYVAAGMFPYVYKWTREAETLLPEHYKRRCQEFMTRDPSPVHYRPNPNRFTVRESTGERSVQLWWWIIGHRCGGGGSPLPQKIHILLWELSHLIWTLPSPYLLWFYLFIYIFCPPLLICYWLENSFH